MGDLPICRRRRASEKVEASLASMLVDRTTHRIANGRHLLPLVNEVRMVAHKGNVQVSLSKSAD